MVVHRQLHKLWTKAVGQEGYDKAEWKRLELLIHRTCLGQVVTEETR